MRVFLCAGDGSGWAIDEDRRTTMRALTGLVELVDRPELAEVIHACWWEPLVELPAASMAGKPVVCHCVGEPARCLAEPRFARAMARVTHWVAHSRAAADDLAHAADDVTHIPYLIDPRWFEETEEGPATAAARAEIPPISYVVANFHRDTAGAGLDKGERTPKLVKGPDVFVEIVHALSRRGVPVVALLAGPRRHWLRRELSKRHVRFVFAGELTAGDDYPKNILPRSELAGLYRLADVYLCTSRSEGGPRTILEAAACGTPVLSTRVGIAPDILPPDGIFDDPASAVEVLERDAAEGVLRRWADAQRERVRAACSIEEGARRWRDFYARLKKDPTAAAARPARPVRSIARHVAPVVSLWNHFRPPPWGGGNQFMLALKAELDRRGVRTVLNGGDGAGERPVAHILNSVQFDVDRFRSMVEPGSARVVHRIDGPISVLRGTPESLEQDRLCFDVNERYAAATVIQSRHTLRFLREMGLRPVRPVIIHNGCDPAIFHPDREFGARPVREGEPLRIIASAWSPSPGKGAAVYQWLARRLDPAKFKFTFVGNCPAELADAEGGPGAKREPVGSEALAAMLREHDVYLTASRNDPCSNALIEALACGLPAIYHDSGGHPELVRFGGLPFRRPEEIPVLLQRVRANLGLYRALIRAPRMEDVAGKYLALLLDDEPFAP